MSTEKNNQNQITFIVKREKIQPIITSYFNKITEDQWRLLASSSVDSETQAILIDMISEILQSVAADILNTVMLTIQNRISDHAQTKTDEKTVIVSLEDSIPESIAAALNVSPEKCESSEELTAIIGDLISQKVNAIISKIAETQVWPPQPAVYVSSSLFNRSTLHRMMLRAVACLRRYLERLKSACLGLCCRPKEHTSQLSDSSSSSSSLSEILFEEFENDVSQDEKYTICLHSADNRTPQEIDKDCQLDVEETPDEYCLSPTSQSIPLYIAAPETRQATIITWWESENSDKSFVASDPFRDMEQAVDEAGEDITSKSETSEATDDKNRANVAEFFEFAQKQFKEMISKMKESFQTSDIKFLVSLKDGLQRIKTDFVLPGRAQESPSDAIGSTPLTTEMEESSDLDFGTFKSQVDNFYYQTVLEIINSDEIKEFSKELTDKLYSHLMRSHNYKIPDVPKGRILSDSILSRKEMMDTQIGRTFSPEVLYAMTEDAVGKFLQKIFLWKENENSDQFSDNDEELYSPTNSLTSLTSEKSCFNLMPGGFVRVTYINCDDSSPPSPPSSCELFDESCGFDVLCRYKSPTSSSFREVYSESSFIESSQESTPESIKTLSITTQLMTDNLINSLFVRLVSNSTKEFTKSLKIEEIKEVMSRLTGKVLENRNLKDVTVRVNNDNVEQFIQELVKDLHEKFGSSEMLLTAAMDPGSADFDNAVLTYLKNNASFIPTPERYTFVGFCTKVGQYFEKPFK